MINRRVIFLVSVFLQICSIGLSQSFVFKNYGASDGLPHSKVNAVIQSPDGYIWVGTEGGLSRLDGQKIKNYFSADSLAESNAGCLALDGQGKVWVGHLSGGISHQNGKGFKRVIFPSEIQPKRIFCLFFDREGNGWAGTQDAGVVFIPAVGDSIKSFSKIDGIWDVVTRIMQDKSGKMWFVTDGGVFTANKGTFRFDRFVNDDMTNYPVTSICEDKKGDIFFGTYQGGLAWYKVSEGKILLQNSVNGLPSMDIFSLAGSANGKLLVGSWGSGLILFDGKNYESISKKEGIAGNKIRCLFEDREGNIWAGTNEDGLSCFRGKRFAHYSKTQGLPHPITNAVVAGNHGEIWVGTQEGLTKLEFSSNGMLKESIRISLQNPAGSMEVLSLAKTASGMILAGTNGGGVEIIHPDKNKVVNALFRLTADNVTSILADSRGVIWIGTINGINCYKDKEFTHLGNYGIHNGLPGNDIASMAEMPNGNIMVGSRNGGLAVVDARTRKVKTIGSTEGFTHNSPVSFSFDKKGNTWIGTEGGGVFLYDGKSCRHFGTKENLPSEFITFIRVEGETIWLGTNRGLSRWNPESGEIRTFNEADGLPANETRTNAVCRGLNGDLYFGTLEGLVRYQKRFDVPNQVQPITHITRFGIFLEEADMGKDTLLDHTRHDVSFDFIGLSFTAPENVRYVFKLEGFDEKWKPVTADMKTNYTNLSFGKYSFLVKASNNEGIWNAEPTRFDFEILPPWYLTRWAFAAYVFLLIGGPILYVRWRTQKLLKDKRVLEEQVKQRTLEIANKNVMLETANTEIMLNRDEIAAKNKDITDSIQYAKRIQQATLPNQEVLKNLLPEHFILFMPRDIVSGDFYWFYEVPGTEGPDYVFALGDCTGHGVPGAFLTMIGNNMLNQIVIEGEEKNPAKILSQLNNRIKFALKQAGSESETRDGMDIAICNWNMKEKVLHFAGANRPMWFIKDENLEALSPDKTAIGGFTPENFVFTNQTIQWKDAFEFYFFTDGYADQFGGPSGKKFMQKKLKQLLIEIHSRPLDEQKKILEKEIMEWKSGIGQVDDITAAGFRLRI